MSQDDLNMMIPMTEEQLTALSDSVRSGLDQGQRTHLDQLELRIQDHRDRVALGLLEIGRCLNEARDARLVPHGCWQQWVAAQTGLNPRTAQRVMRAAREVPKASALTHLDFGKINALLALPAEEREEFAAVTDAEHKTLRQLEEAIRAKKAAEQRADAAERDMTETRRRASREHADMESALRRANELSALLDKARQNPTVVEREVVPADYEAIKARDLTASARIREAEDYADAQEERVRELQARLDAVTAGAADRADDVQRFVGSCSDFMGAVCRYPNMDDAQLLRGKSRADLESMRTWVSMIHQWASTMEVRLTMPAGLEVDGDVR